MKKIIVLASCLAVMFMLRNQASATDPTTAGGTLTVTATVDPTMKVLRVEQDIAGKKRSGFSGVGKGFSLHAISKKPLHWSRLSSSDSD